MKTTLLCLVLAAGCSELDPNVGPWRVQQPDESDAAVSGDAGSDGDDDVPPGSVSFALDIRPMLERPKDYPTGRGCKSCHFRNQPTHNGTDLSGLDMSTLGELRKGGGSSGARIIVPGKPEESAIVQALRGQYPYSARMPKSGGAYWGDEEMRLITTWISEGAIGRDQE
jgi:hypothetical protein